MVLHDDRGRPRILDWDWTVADAAVMSDDEPSATVTLTARSLAAGVGVTAGTGTLVFKGERHAFRFRGLVLGGLEAATGSAAGNVYGLARVSDFAGRYAGVQAGAALGAAGGGLMARNDKGVVVRLRTTTRGVQLRLGTGGIDVELEKPPSRWRSNPPAILDHIEG